jgi:biotin carboxyl carrier protein
MAKLAVTIDDHTYNIELTLAPKCSNGCKVKVNGEEMPLAIPDPGSPLWEVEWIIVDGRPYELTFEENLQWIKAYSGLHRVKIHDHAAKVITTRSSDGRVKAPIPGLITRILIKEGERIKVGQPILVLEAMKMENEIRAPLDGQIESFAVEIGQTVAQNDLLARIGRS